MTAIAKFLSLSLPLSLPPINVKTHKEQLSELPLSYL